MLKKLKNYAFQAISFILAAYGFYLLYLFFLDTTLRVSRVVAYPVSIGLTLILVIATILYWVKKKKLPL